MDYKKRIAFNVVYIYAGVILCTLLSLLTVPILLKNLGESDYGIYNLVAGVITMLSFFKGSMVVSIQRFMNVAYGENNLEKVNRLFSVGVVLFLIVGIFITIVIELLGPFISNGYLNINPSRIGAATLLFQVLVFSTFITMVGVPYDALFNVHEDMGLYSIFNSLEAIFRLITAIGLGFVNVGDKLVIYAISMVFITLIVFILKFIVCKSKYKNIRYVKLVKSDISIVKDIMSFIGWNLYSSLAKIFSTQGYAIVLNLFMGTTINASYGIANQINSALQHFTTSIEKAFNPQIMKSAGMNDDFRMVKLSLYSTKYCSLIYLFFSIPLLSSLSFILDIWLINPPMYTLEFARIIISASIVSMMTLGMAPMLYAKGTIKNYLFTLGTLLIFVVFAAYVVLKIGFGVNYAVALFILLEVILLFVRLYYCKHLVGMKIKDYFVIVLYPVIKVAMPTFIITSFFNVSSWPIFFLLILVSVIVYITCAYLFSLSDYERRTVNNAFSTFRGKIQMKF